MNGLICQGWKLQLEKQRTLATCITLLVDRIYYRTVTRVFETEKLTMI